MQDVRSKGHSAAQTRNSPTSLSFARSSQKPFHGQKTLGVRQLSETQVLVSPLTRNEFLKFLVIHNHLNSRLCIFSTYGQRASPNLILCCLFPTSLESSILYGAMHQVNGRYNNKHYYCSKSLSLTLTPAKFVLQQLAWICVSITIQLAWLAQLAKLPELVAGLEGGLAKAIIATIQLGIWLVDTLHLHTRTTRKKQ